MHARELLRLVLSELIGVGWAGPNAVRTLWWQGGAPLWGWYHGHESATLQAFRRFYRRRTWLNSTSATSTSLLMNLEASTRQLTSRSENKYMAIAIIARTSK